MSRPDFEARLKKISKVPSVGAKRAVDKALLQHKIDEMRRKPEDDLFFTEDDGADSWAAWLSVFLLICFLVLGTLYAQDADAAKTKAVVMVPLMVLLVVIIAVRNFRRSSWDFLQWNLWVDLDFIEKLFRFLR